MCERSDKKCSPKNFLGPFRPQFGLKIRGGGGGVGGGGFPGSSNAGKLQH